MQVARDGSIPFDDAEVARRRLARRPDYRLQVLEAAAGKRRMKLPLSRVAEFLSATGEFDPKAVATGYSIDSRTIQPGELFFAVKGERIDGHDFVEQALEKGAVAAVVRKDQAGPAVSGKEPICWSWTTRWRLCRL